MWERKEGGRKSVREKGRWQEERERERKVAKSVWERKEGGRQRYGVERMGRQSVWEKKAGRAREMIREAGRVPGR